MLMNTIIRIMIIITDNFTYPDTTLKPLTEGVWIIKEGTVLLKQPFLIHCIFQ